MNYCQCKPFEVVYETIFCVQFFFCLVIFSSALKKRSNYRKLDGAKQVYVIFKTGIYYFPETVQFTPNDNMQNGVIFEPENEGTVVISGGKKCLLRVPTGID